MIFVFKSPHIQPNGIVLFQAVLRNIDCIGVDIWIPSSFMISCEYHINVTNVSVIILTTLELLKYALLIVSWNPALCILQLSNKADCIFCWSMCVWRSIMDNILCNQFIYLTFTPKNVCLKQHKYEINYCKYIQIFWSKTLVY